jgi:hypothetical protein
MVTSIKKATNSVKEIRGYTLIPVMFSKYVENFMIIELLF